MALNPAQQLANAIVQRAMQGTDIALSKIQIPQEWPVSATLGVEYKVHDCQFPQVNHEYEVAYFDNVAGLIQWLEHKREWIIGTDYDFSMQYSVYTWDWGPVFKYSKTM